MASVILFANGKARDEIKEISAAISGVNGVDLMIVGDSSLEGAAQEATLIAADGSSIAEAARSAVKAASSEQIVFVDARLPFTAQMMQAFIQESAAAADNMVMHAAVEFGSEFVDAADISADQIISMVKTSAEWPVAVISARRAFISSELSSDANNSFELMVQLLIRAMSSGAEIATYSSPLKLSNEAAAEICKPRAESLARVLNGAMNAFAIEELFPNHSWKEHCSEAAAASYQTAAAMFIKLGETAGALECLQISDGLEESPRSLALRALIAQSRGETLGAVANMVSSLQQYEVRKKSDRHYISFEPKDIETVNSCLVSGLEALNRRDNTEALDHFAEAVFNFDSFYSQYGLDRDK